jgi:hypothetical protein
VGEERTKNEKRKKKREWGVGEERTKNEERKKKRE